MHPITQKLAAVAAVILAVATLALIETSDANANPTEWEFETVESLLLGDPLEASQRPAFNYTAPASTCTDANGRHIFTGCPDVTWLCPQGITDGALGRLETDIDYDRQILGYESRQSMCIETTPSLNPQPATPLPTATTLPIAVPAQPVPVFTG